MGMLLVALVFGVISAFFCGHLATSKGLDSGSWFVVGLLFGPLGLLAAAGMPDRMMRQYLRAIVEAQGIETKSIEPEISDLPLKENEFIADKGSMKESLWESVLEILDPAMAGEASFKKSWFYRNLIVVRSGKGEQLARASCTRLAFGRQRWKVERQK